MLFELLVNSNVAAVAIKKLDIKFSECNNALTETIEEKIMIYTVGGCVRDKVMNRLPKDIDYVVVGASEKDMIDMGFEKVGAGFPVFLHPSTREEYALARTEKKTGAGYLGFETYFGKDVTLEQDLERRDFTMNAMASRNSKIYDPFNGVSDIENGIIRHVNTKAFIEDPVRILRAARFAARYDFKVCQETLNLINQISLEEIESVPRERVVLELEKSLKDGRGYQFLKNLYEFGYVHVDLFFECPFSSNFVYIDEVYKELGMEGVMCLLAEFGEDGVMFLNKYKSSSDTIFLYRLIQQSGQRHHFTVDDAFNLIQRSDYYRRPDFLLKLEKYMRATTVNLSTIAHQLSLIKVTDLEPGLKGVEIRDALNEKRKKLFDELVGL